jgi:hypothetical protein
VRFVEVALSFRSVLPDPLCELFVPDAVGAEMLIVIVGGICHDILGR